MPERAKRPGGNNGGGRRKMNPPTKPHTIRITIEQAKLLRMWGRGDMSLGLRWLIETARLVIAKP